MLVKVAYHNVLYEGKQAKFGKDLFKKHYLSMNCNKLCLNQNCLQNIEAGTVPQNSILPLSNKSKSNNNKNEDVPSVVPGNLINALT